MMSMIFLFIFSQRWYNSKIANTRLRRQEVILCAYFIELVLLPILAGTLANVLSEWLIRFVASKCDKKKK
ncbi:hypothetical protein [Streptococcus sp. 9903]|uniref:hypothetical protein n=1 Tax=Streptococcus sp. 9903 TaxID=2582677 RepID=UPI00156380C8|nr:hypothetical protein [Streptococcus sp. 9903]